MALATPVAVMGAHYTRSGEFELVVHHRKNAETRFKETLTAIISPKKVTHAISASVDLPLLAELHHTAAQSDITREGWSFEIGEPEALDAYKKLLHGVLPGASLALATTGPLDVARLNALTEAEKLPRGVKRLFTERARLVRARATGGGITLPRYIPGLKWAGLGTERRTSHVHHSIADTSGAVASEHHTLETEQQRLRAGVRTHKLSVQNQQIAVAQEPALHEQGVLLAAKLGVDRTRRHNRDALVDVLNDSRLGRSQAERFAYQEANGAQTYTVSIEGALTEAHLGRLLTLSGDPSARTAVSAPLRRLLSAVRGQKAGASATTALLAEFLSETGVAGMRDMQDVLGDAEWMSVEPNSSARADVAQDVLSLTARYSAPIDPADQSKATLKARIRQVSEAVSRADKAAEDLRRDPLLELFDPDKKIQDLRGVVADKKALQALLDTSHLGPRGQATLTPKLSQRTKRRMKEAAGPTSVELAPLHDDMGGVQ